MNARLQRALEDGMRYANGVREALDEIYESRDRGEHASLEQLKVIELLVEDCAGHEAFADTDGFRKGYRL